MYVLVTALASVVLAGLSLGSARAAGCGTLDVGQELTVGATVESCDGAFRWAMQGDGNFVQYRTRDGVAVWSTNSSGSGATRIVFQGDGNLVLSAPSGPVWDSKSGGAPGASVAFQGDGNIVVYRGAAVSYSNGQAIPYLDAVIGQWRRTDGSYGVRIDAAGNGYYTGNTSFCSYNGAVDYQNIARTTSGTEWRAEYLTRDYNNRCSLRERSRTEIRMDGNQLVISIYFEVYARGVTHRYDRV